MGRGQSKDRFPKEGDFFLEGPQNFAYDTRKPVFARHNGLLFRLINSPERQWAYYNDTKKYEFHVTATIGPQSTNLMALGKTSLVEVPEGGWVAKTIVYPGLTEPFLQGNIVGFDSSVDAVLLTNEYKEKHREEKKQAKKEAKRAAKYGDEPPRDDERNDDELGNARERN
ncbi:calpain-like cysteine peptidase, Clan CA, family C2 [Strigomonas culicis]|uniref:Calpain-like cysteine peptidase, Clan CA, family C2 n=1 Tax=Strigomonas culicis TaxID=28005 RepID=S9UZV1_9TRYP|nr:calpain-like cysteine peptidase, Clan CA, family C2 [Strigomonas culicis]|eukprot:EPY34294.1 calpain-like cysteine peptidase, Clan CA, family C2 [Strigomonas culicis]